MNHSPTTNRTLKIQSQHWFSTADGLTACDVIWSAYTSSNSSCCGCGCVLTSQGVTQTLQARKQCFLCRATYSFCLFLASLRLHTNPQNLSYQLWLYWSDPGDWQEEKETFCTEASSVKLRLLHTQHVTHWRETRDCISEHVGHRLLLKSTTSGIVTLKSH